MARKKKNPQPVLEVEEKLQLEWSVKNEFSWRELDSYSQRVWWSCVDCGNSWITSFGNRVKKSHSTGCPFCARREISRKAIARSLTVDNSLREFEKLCREFDVEKNFPSTVDSFSKGSRRKVWWRCSGCGHSWCCTVQSRTIKDSGCPVCSRGGSKLEEKVYEIVREFYSGEVIVHSRPIVCEDQSRLEIDFLLPDLALGFEVQDFRSHSRDSDSEFCRFPSGVVKKGPEYHERKVRLALAQLGVNIVELWEDEVKSGVARVLVKEAIAQSNRSS